MVSKITIGDVRGLLMNADKRPVLRLLPELDEVSRGYALAHLGDAEDIAKQVWLLNATDWIRGEYDILLNLCKDLDYSGFDRELHTFSLKIAEDALKDSSKKTHDKQGCKVLKEGLSFLDSKRKWINGEVSNKELRKRIYELWDVYRAANNQSNWATYWAAYKIASSAASLSAEEAAYNTISWAVYRTEYRDEERKKQLELLGDILEDSVGIQRGFEGESLESKVSEGGL